MYMWAAIISNGYIKHVCVYTCVYIAVVCIAVSVYSESEF